MKHLLPLLFLAACNSAPPVVVPRDSSLDASPPLDSLPSPDSSLDSLPSPDSSLDAPPPPDTALDSELPPPDAPLPDASPDLAPACGALTQPCCAASPSCAPDLLCLSGRCAACPPGESLCGDVCRDLRTDPLDCGACGARCPAGRICVAGACACPSPTTFCGDTCVTLATATEHCGACGRSCVGTIPNATAQCVASRCVLASCDAEHLDCDGDPSNGCETSPLSSVDHCGRCGRSCVPMAGRGVSCQAGRCVDAPMCDPGLADCAPGSGCETNIATDRLNCGACDRVCSDNHGIPRCMASRCSTLCDDGFADCDGNADNGCEVALDTSTLHCGACGARCSPPHATAACARGRCAIGSCDPGYADCDGVLANGCELAVSSSLTHCGRCGAACWFADGIAECRAGSCTLARCNAGRGDCDGIAANGCETPLNSTTDCGACRTPCTNPTYGATCETGRCELRCANRGRAECDGDPRTECETQPSVDPLNCGGCGVACPIPIGAGASAGCSGGSCRVVCGWEYADCDLDPRTGCEVSLGTDVRNCAACRRECFAQRSVMACRVGNCVITGCLVAGRADCDTNEYNHCETDLRTDPLHCGACGRVCPSSPLARTVRACVAGACATRCAAGYADCDGNVANGCERDARTDAANCGACGRVCAAGRDCLAGECALPAPASLSAPLSHLAAVLARDGYVYAFGSGRTERYDVAANAWTTRAPMPTSLRGCAATQLLDGRILVAGGVLTTGGSTEGATWFYDPVMDRWSAGRMMSFGSEGSSSYTAATGLVYVVSRGPIHVYDPTATLWSTLPLTSYGPAYGFACRLEETTFVFGRDFGSGGASSGAARYDFAAQRWINVGLGASQTALGAAGAIDRDGRIFLMGGSDRDGTASTSLRLDPDTLQNQTVVAPPVRRQYAAAVALADGRILVIGGQRVGDLAPLASVTYYSPSGDFWR